MADWQIHDNNGVIHAGTESEMQRAFELMTTELHELEENYPDENISALKQEKESWMDNWVGDLMLIQIHNIYR